MISTFHITRRISVALMLLLAASAAVFHSTAACVSAAPGIVAWWKAEASGNDVLGNNNATLSNLVFSAGEVGQAFSFNGSNSAASIPASATLNVGLGNGFTIEGWINPADISQQRPIIEWNSAATGYGVHVWQSVASGGVTSPGSLLANIMDTGHGDHSLNTGPNALTQGTFQHIALTFNRTNGAAVLYINGIAVAQASLGSFVPQTSTDLYLGYRPYDLAAGTRFPGLIDEMAIYNRVLSSNEVAGIYLAGADGKCTTIAPIITSQPTNQSVLLGAAAAFSVSAAGPRPLSYQWYFNDTNAIPDATNSTFSLASAQTTNAGTYKVTVSNTNGATTSSNATLNVIPPPPCAAIGSGLVSWWRAESNTLDFAGANNGVASGAVRYAPGEAGTGFLFDGSTSSVTLGNPASLQLQNFTIEAWIKRTSGTVIAFNQNQYIGGTYVGPGGEFFGYGQNGYSFGMMDNGQMYITKIGVDGITLTNVAVTDTNQFHHVAVTKSGTTVMFYLDGAAYGPFFYGTAFSFTTSAAIGARGDVGGWFYGAIDEVAVYNNALSSDEIHAIYTAGVSGKCVAPTAPFIATQPTNQTVAVGGTANFSVVADGSSPLSYQWTFNTTNIPGATGATLTLTNVQPAQAGLYAVIISNAVSPVTSSNATLTVIPPPGCVATVPNLVSWWRGESNTTDFISANNGTLAGNATYAPGKVGTGFVFDGFGDAVALGNPTNLQLQDFTIEAWIKRANASQVSQYNGGNSGGELFSYGSLGYGFIIQNNGNLALSKIDINNVQVATPVTDTNWHHVAVTKAGTNVYFYVDGVAIHAPAYSTTFTFGTTVAIGARGDNLVSSFWGNIDELAVYNRALTAGEIQSIYGALAAGKCPTPTAPYIISQPLNSTVIVGGAATFTVTAGGTQPLTYQWSLNTTNIPGATNSILSLTNIQFSQAGTYAVTVANNASGVTSSNAVLTVNPPPPCVPAVSNLVSWWQGEGNVTDLIGNNNGVVTGGVAYVAGKVGQAFSFNGSNSLVRVPASSSLNVGLADGFTIEGWINPADLAQRPIIEWNSGSSYGVHLWMSLGSGGANLPGSIYANIIDTSQIGHLVNTTAGILSAGVFQHIALSLNRTNGSATLYMNGAVVATASLGVFNPLTGTDMFLGYRAGGSAAGTRFLGQMDEMALYNRALSSNEIAAIYAAGAAGKCTTPVSPFITTQPASQTVLVGANATFTVGAGGSQPLSYQWSLNTTNILGATNSILSLTNIQFAQAGNYSVTITNAASSITSSNAILTVNPPPPCVPAVSNLVSWWRGENDTSDFAGLNPGTLAGNTTYAPGKVGTGFVFDGSGDAVALGNPTNLQLQDFTIEAWIKRSSSSQVSLYNGGNSGGELFSYGSLGYGFIIQNNGNLALSKIDVSNVQVPTPVTDTNWHHVAVSKAGSNVVFYVDGVTIPGPTYNIAFTFGTTVAIGARADNLSSSFLGNIDELAVYSRALTAGEIQAIYGASVSGKCQTQLPPSIVIQPANRTALLGSTTTFSVVAGGSQPLSYQWSLNTTNLPGATNSTLVLTNVQFSQAGSYAVTISNGASSITSSNALLTVVYPPALVRLVAATGAVGQTVSVPVQLIANGNENALGFSLNFDTNILSASNVVAGANSGDGSILANLSLASAGHLGAAIALQSGESFAPGTQEVLIVNFTVVAPPAGSNTTSLVAFADVPTARQLSDPAAGILTAFYSNAVVTVPAAEWEGDTSPRPNGDRQVSITDWVQVGRFVAGLDTPGSGDEFARADCAPRASLGNGVLSVTDWVQAGRYAAGLDPLTIAGGPTAVSNNVVHASPRNVGRVVRVVSQPVQAAETNTISVQLASQGNENALGFSLVFDPSVMTYLSATLGSDVSGGSINLNTSATASGKLGVVLALPTGNVFATGTRDILKVNFVVSGSANGSSNISFGSSPIVSEVSDASANSLSATYTAGTVAISPFPPVLRAAATSSNVIVAWPAVASDFSLQVNASGATSSNWTAGPTGAVIQGAEKVLTITNPVGSQFFRLYRP